MGNFILNHKTRIHTDWGEEPVKRAIVRFERDMHMTLIEEGLLENEIEIRHIRHPQAEWYQIQVKDEKRIIIEASDELGAVYALLELSRRFLGVLPFWFWNDQRFKKKKCVEIPFMKLEAMEYSVKYRGWFINDEVLISHWNAGVSEEYPWEMAIEALLRCGGNMVIPGTGRNSRKYENLASGMGLWITQHHAEPLGAEMFLRAYPDLNPSFEEHPEEFRKLWKDAVERLKEKKVIWNLGFRGQGDVPFWENDSRYDTPEKRGALISSIMQEQYDLVTGQVKDPVCCVNLYGETMELYQQGNIILPDGVIMIWADNGYGKMVSRRQGNHNPRILALPDRKFRSASHGMYYHASFYDLQAANVLTAMPNSPEFVKKEVEHAYQCGIRDFWLINCSNVKPHVYLLGFLAEMWRNIDADPADYCRQYILQYYLREHYDENLAHEIRKCIQTYFSSMPAYGYREDEHAGEQFYNYITRVFIHYWMKFGGIKPCEELQWFSAKTDFSGQLEDFRNVCCSGISVLEQMTEFCTGISRKLEENHYYPVGQQMWKDSWLLQAKIHTYCARGVIRFTDAWKAYEGADFMRSFWCLGQAADCFQMAQDTMMEACHDKWRHFYDNDCQTDIKHTVYLLQMLMAYVRNVGDGPYFYHWQREVLDDPCDRNIFLILNEENHLTDQAFYGKMKETDYFA